MIARESSPDTAADASPGRWREAGWYVLTAGLCVLVLAAILIPAKVDLRIPLGYASDAIGWAGVETKTTLDTGWYLTNDALGLPGRLDMRGFPQSDTLHFIGIKAIGLFARDWPLTVNLYYLLAFPLTALLALWSLRQFGVNPLLAVALAVLYAFLPFRLLRGIAHIWLAYWMVPPGLVVADRLLRAQFPDSGSWRYIVRTPGFLGSALICVLLPMTGVYWGYFGAAMLLFAGGVAAVRARRFRALLPALLMSALIMFSAVASITPTIVQKLSGELSAGMVMRSPRMAEVYGLKIDQLFLPVDSHRIPAFARIKQFYHVGLQQMGPYMDNESTTSSLGIIGSVGFVVALGVFMLGRRRRRPAGGTSPAGLYELGQMQLFAVLLGTVGGLGAVLAIVVLREIRSYNRLSILIGFLAFVAVGLLAQSALARVKGDRARAWLTGALAMLLLVAGLLDQIPADMGARFSEPQKAWAADVTYFAKVERALPAKTAVFQMPYMSFPEPGGPIGSMGDYEHMRAFLHTEGLRWSYGAPKGSPADFLQARLATTPGSSLVAAVEKEGFEAVYVDRRGYDGQPLRLAEIETALSAASLAPPLVSADGTLEVYRLR